jgi:hypothetical protein
MKMLQKEMEGEAEKAGIHSGDDVMDLVKDVHTEAAKDNFQDEKNCFMKQEELIQRAHYLWGRNLFLKVAPIYLATLVINQSLRKCRAFSQKSLFSKILDILYFLRLYISNMLNLVCEEYEQ